MDAAFVSFDQKQRRSAESQRCLEHWYIRIIVVIKGKRILLYLCRLLIPEEIIEMFSSQRRCFLNTTEEAVGRAYRVKCIRS